jgi:hypothetical protein
MLESLLPGLLGGVLGGRSGSTKTSLNSANNLSTQVSSAQNFGLSNNPTIANVIGAGSAVAPNTTSPISTPVHLQPSFSAPLNQTASDGGASALPRFTPTGFGGSTGTAYRPPVGLGMSDDLLLLMLLVGGAFLLMQPSAKGR